MNQNKYRTTSLSLAAAIQLASSSKLLCIEKSAQNARATFVFNYTNDIERTVEQFWQKQLSKDLFSYFETIKYLKSRLYEEGTNS